MSPLEQQLYEALKESHAASAALMRVVYQTMAVDVMEEEFEISGIRKGFGVRAQQAIEEAQRQLKQETPNASY